MNKEEEIQNRLNYYRLVDRVNEIDSEAAFYLLFDAITRPEFTYRGSLVSCFVWDDTPQGHVFWSDLDYKLREEIK